MSRVLQMAMGVLVAAMAVGGCQDSTGDGGLQAELAPGSGHEDEPEAEPVSASGDEGGLDAELAPDSADEVDRLKAEFAEIEDQLLSHEERIAECMAAQGFQYGPGLDPSWILERPFIRNQMWGGTGITDVELPDDAHEAYLENLSPGERAAFRFVLWGDIDIGGTERGCKAKTQDGEDWRSEQPRFEVVAEQFEIGGDSDDCTDPPLPPSRLSRHLIEEKYPVLDLAIRGLLPEAYAEDPTLDLYEHVSYSSGRRLSPVRWAIRRHCHELFDWLVGQGVLEGERAIEGWDPTPWHHTKQAAWADNLHALEVLLDREPDLDINEFGGVYSPLIPLLHEVRSVEAARLLLAAGADPNLRAPNDRAIDYQATLGNAEVVELLYPLTDSPSAAIYLVIDSAHSRKGFGAYGGQVEPLLELLEVLVVLKRLGGDINVPPPENVYLWDTNASTPAEYARQYEDGALFPEVIAFVEDWAAE